MHDQAIGTQRLAARQRVVGAGIVVDDLVVHRPHERDVMHLPRQQRQMFANLRPRNAGRNRLKVAANLGRRCRLHIPQVLMSRTALKKEENAVPRLGGFRVGLSAGRTGEQIGQIQRKRTERANPQQPIAAPAATSTARIQRIPMLSDCRTHNHAPRRRRSKCRSIRRVFGGSFSAQLVIVGLFLPSDKQRHWPSTLFRPPAKPGRLVWISDRVTGTPTADRLSTQPEREALVSAFWPEQHGEA